MKIALSLLGLFFAFASVFANAQTSTVPDSWVRVESKESDFSVGFPSPDFLTRADEGRYNIWYSEKGLSLKTTFAYPPNPKKEVARLGGYLKEPGTKSFNSGDFVGVWFVRVAPGTQKRTAIFYLASSKGIYTIEAVNSADTAESCDRFLRSIRLGGKQIINVAKIDPAESQTLNVKSLVTSEIIKQALKQRARTDLKLDKTPSPANGVDLEETVYTRPLIILSEPHASYSDYARERGIRGNIRIAVTFLADGTIGKIRLLQGLEKSLNDNVLEAARQIKFVPAQIDGKSVEITATFDYGFNID
jgi:TonB family protein